MWRKNYGKIISTHAPAGGATLLRRAQREAGMDHFYSRPCGRGDQIMLAKLTPGREISTHAPAGGATDCRAVFREPCFISTHAPAGGATSVRSPVLVIDSFISTHAPAGGATCRFPSRPYRADGNFYSRPCGRGDKCRSSRRSSAFYFYSRPCGRGDPPVPGPARSGCHFYSRPCGRGDRYRREQEQKEDAFLLTPLREGRQIGHPV